MQPQEQATGVRFQRGNIVLTIDSPNFCNGFFRRRESHHNECEEEPRRERELVAADFLELIALPVREAAIIALIIRGINNLGVFT